MMQPSVIVITGASSGIGSALAADYAKPGTTLGLLGRDAARLDTIASACIAKGAAVKTGVLDVRDREGMNAWLLGFHAAHPIDLLVANAGISAGTCGMNEPEDQVRNIFAVNVDGVLNSVLPVLPLMRKRRFGQIALISSLAGIRGLPGCPTYSASKMTVRGLGEGWRKSLEPEGVRISVVCPGYIRTPMTDVNTFPMPFIMSAEKASRIIITGLQKNRPRIAFPLALFLPLWLISCLPPRLVDPFFAALPQKTAMEKA